MPSTRHKPNVGLDGVRVGDQVVTAVAVNAQAGDTMGRVSNLAEPDAVGALLSRYCSTSISS
jgi:hypothetical protein